MIDRRTIVIGALSSFGTPTSARAQSVERVRRLGILLPFASGDKEIQDRVVEFREVLRGLGWVEGKNIKIDERWATDNLARVESAAAELVTLKPDAILVVGRRVIPIARRLTTSIPIIGIGLTESVREGFAASLDRPGGNLTGFELLEYSIVGKSVELLKEIAPHITQIAVLVNPDNPASTDVARVFKDATAELKIEPELLFARQLGEYRDAINAFGTQKNRGMVFPPDLTLTAHRAMIVGLVAQRQLPAFYFGRAMVRAGGLISYGAVLGDLYRRAAFYVNLILRGKKPGDLPIQRPEKYELIVNLKTAKAMDIDIPTSILLRAEEVIE